MLETSARLLRLLSLLQTHRDWTGTELADRLDVTPRTVRNDVERLRTLGYPVHATRGAAGGYRLGAGASLPPLLLDDEEAVAVAVGLRTAAGGTVSGIEETSLRALAKLEQVLPTRLRRRVNALHAYTVPVPGQEGPRVETEVLTAIAAACRDHERMRFGYQDHGGNETVRNVEPYRMINWGRRWYLLAWDVERDDWRIFRVDRIVPRNPTGARFTPRDLPSEDVADYVSKRVSAAPWRTKVRVVVQAPAADIAARVPWFAGSVEPLDDETCVFTTGSNDPASLVVWLGLLGADFTVENAPELAVHMRTLAERMTRAAETSQ